MISKCENCGSEVEMTKSKKEHRRRIGILLCSHCTKERQRKISSETMSRTNRIYSSERMKKNNPMYKEDVRAKVSTTLRAMGWKPTVRGGNGTGPTVHQMLLASALGWEMEVVVPTGHWRDGSGYPTCYKIDIANPSLKIAIEVDGESHSSFLTKERDKKKERFLVGKGWKVVRFTNKDVGSDLNGCVKTVLSMI